MKYEKTMLPAPAMAGAVPCIDLDILAWSTLCRFVEAEPARSRSAKSGNCEGREHVGFRKNTFSVHDAARRDHGHCSSPSQAADPLGSLSVTGLPLP